MSALTGSQINQSYQGLIKLADSTTGITSTFQSIQDGLGNNTGLKISTKGLSGANYFGYNKPAVAQYYGTGISSAAMTAPPAGWENDVNIAPFYDNGIYSYSAVTMLVTTNTGSESLEFAFYDAQYIDGYGYIPGTKISSTMTGDCSTTGFKTITPTSPFSFSGSGPGIYFFAFRLVAAGTPAQRWGAPTNAPATYIQNISPLLGYQFNTTSASAPASWKGISSTANQTAFNFNGLTSFPTTWSTANWDTIANGLTTSPFPGYLLHTVR